MIGAGGFEEGEAKGIARGREMRGVILEGRLELRRRALHLGAPLGGTPSGFRHLSGAAL